MRTPIPHNNPKIIFDDSLTPSKNSIIKTTADKNVYKKRLIPK